MYVYVYRYFVYIYTHLYLGKINCRHLFSCSCYSETWTDPVFPLTPLTWIHAKCGLRCRPFCTILHCSLFSTEVLQKRRTHVLLSLSISFLRKEESGPRGIRSPHSGWQWWKWRWPGTQHPEERGGQEREEPPWGGAGPWLWCGGWDGKAAHVRERTRGLSCRGGWEFGAEGCSLPHAIPAHSDLFAHCGDLDDSCVGVRISNSLSP